jgi:hypothetical protein
VIRLKLHEDERRLNAVRRRARSKETEVREVALEN